MQQILEPRLLSFVLPVCLNETIEDLHWRQGLDNAGVLRFQTLLKSFLCTFELNELSRFFIVCPPEEEEKIRDSLRELTDDSRFYVISELDFLPELHELRNIDIKVPGWYVQQIIKLAAARMVTTRYFLTLDSDIICRKKFHIASLMSNNRALLNTETFENYLQTYKLRYALNEWRIKHRRSICSAYLLGSKRPKSCRRRYYGETPVLMHTRSVVDLITLLTGRYGNWFRCLVEHQDWTEYTLLFQFLELNNTLEKYYEPADHNTLLDLDSSVWKSSHKYRNRRDNSARAILSCREKKAGAFVAIQSYLPTNTWLPTEYSGLADFYADVESLLVHKGTGTD